MKIHQHKVNYEFELTASPGIDMGEHGHWQYWIATWYGDIKDRRMILHANRWGQMKVEYQITIHKWSKGQQILKQKLVDWLANGYPCEGATITIHFRFTEGFWSW